ncbi:MAG: restriction endonuclease, partial [Bacteroidales bacterium]|nr:restriction endonuclease [Bacteroidales bacterium]
MPSRNIQILKASGEKEAFKKEKLIHSLKRSGADSTEVASVVQEMDEWMFDGVSSKDIYKKAFSLLKKKRLGAAARYRLKQAMMEMGPTGYPFEIFIGQIFKSLGYDVEVGITLDGVCVTHEVDVIATKGLTQCFVECKYYQRTGKNANVQVPLYIRSRVNDLIDKRRQSTRWDAFQFEGWIATNTRFTLDAISYGVCSGL